MSTRRLFTTSVVVLVIATGGVSPLLQAQAVHSREFWKQIVSNHYAVPPGAAVFPLASELSTYVSSPDPELRDELAYSILYVWIVRQKLLSHEELLSLQEQWQGNLRAGIGEAGTDSIFRRSFSALCLSIVAERELKDSFLTEAQFRLLLKSAVLYLTEERDLRGFDAQKGWIHATAHTADVLAALARNRLFTRENQSAVLAAVAQRLASANDVFTYGEQDRLANVAVTIATRDDFDAEAWKVWLRKMDQEDQTVWKKSPPEMNALTRFENDTYFLQGTAARLSQQEMTSTLKEVQKELLTMLRER